MTYTLHHLGLVWFQATKKSNDCQLRPLGWAQGWFCSLVISLRLWLFLSCPSAIFNVSAIIHILIKDGCTISRIDCLAHYGILSRKQAEPWQKGLLLLHLSHQGKRSFPEAGPSHMGTLGAITAKGRRPLTRRNYYSI